MSNFQSVINQTNHVLSLEGGGSLGPRQVATVDIDLPYYVTEIAQGRLALTVVPDPTPAIDEPVLVVTPDATTFAVSDQTPQRLTPGGLWIQTGDQNKIRRIRQQGGRVLEDFFVGGTINAIHAEALADHIAHVNVHIDYGSPDYPPYQNYLPGIFCSNSRPLTNTWGYWMLTGPGKQPLGNSLTGARRLIRSMRSGLKPWQDPNAYGVYQSIHANRAYGIKFLGGVGGPTGTNTVDMMNGLHSYVEALGSWPSVLPSDFFAGIEMANEWDMGSGHAVSLLKTELRAQARVIADFFATRRQYDDVPVVLPSLVNTSFYSQIGDMIPYSGGRKGAIAANVHAYPGGLPPESRAGDAINWTALAAPGGNRPIWATEHGYHTIQTTNTPHPGISNAAMASYAVRMALVNTAFLPAHSRTYWYQLIEPFGNDAGSGHDPNNGESGFGLIDTTTNPWTPKAAYSAIRALILLSEDGPDTLPRVDLPLSLSGTIGSTYTLGVYYRDGHYGVWLADSQSVYNTSTHLDITVSPYNVTVNLPRVPKTAMLYDPVNSGTTGTPLTAAASTVVSVSAHRPKLLLFS
jgi:hypothetical protein